MKQGKKTEKSATATGVGAGLGGLAGSSIGIVGFGLGISGMLPLAALGGYAAYRLAKALTKPSGPDEPKEGP